MTWARRPPPGELEAELAKVRAAAPQPSNDPIYKYLRRVYRLRCKVEHSAKLQDAIKAEHAAHFPTTLANYAGVIISLTAPHVTAKARHKYITTIEYAFSQDTQPDRFVEFVKQQGGINKCCELWTATYGGNLRGHRAVHSNTK